MSTESIISNEDQKLRSFAETGPIEIGGMALRPFTAGSLVILQLVKNPILENTSPDNIFYHIASFVYIHTEDPLKVRESARSVEAHREAVLGFVEKLQVVDIVQAVEKIKIIIERAMVGFDYQVESDNDPN